MMLEKGGYLSSAKAKVEEVSSSSLDSTLTITHRKNKKNKRRFSDEQIKSMETMFETESKLEPKTKLQLAKELDLQPRQVAIWFQNRRARWKSKQLERDYNLLKASYDALASQFESMKKEKQMLQKQLQKLNDLRQRNHKEESSRTCQLSLDGNSTDDGDSDNGVSKYEPGGGEEKPELSFGRPELKMGAYSDDDENNHNMYHLGSGEEQEVDLMSVMDPAATNSMILSPGNWSAYDSANNAPFDQSCGNTSQWWEIWS